MRSAAEDAGRMVAERKKNQGIPDWTWRLAGVVLCAFFGFGVFAGLSFANRTSALPSQARLLEYGRGLLARAGVTSLRTSPRPASISPSVQPAGAPVALVERKDGFYALLPAGELRGPVSAQTEGDLPILSGSTLESAGPRELLDYAEVLVRAEAALAELVSEMRLAGDGTAALCLEGYRTEVIVDLANAAPELERAAFLLRRWRGRRDLVTALDMTTPGQAVMRLAAAALFTGDGAGVIEAAVRQSSGSSAPRTRPRMKELAAR